MRNLTNNHLSSPLCRLAAPLLALALLAAGGVPALTAGEGSHVKVGEIVQLGAAVEVVHAFNSGDNRVQIGSSLYVNDVVRTGKNSPTEITFGINVRLRLEGDGEIVIQDVRERSREVDEVPTVSRMVSVLLRRGTLRVRVRENTVNATPVLLNAGEVRFFLSKSDFLLRRAPGDPNPQKMLDCMLAWGKVAIGMRSHGDAAVSDESDAEFGGDNDFVNYQPGRTLVSEVPADNTPPTWQPLDYAAVRKAMQEAAPFSCDQVRELPREVPQENPELRGA